MLVSSDIKEISRKVENRETLTEDEITYLYDFADLPSVGKLARSISDKISGNRVSFVSNIILNYTNICNVRCSFCAFYRTGSEPDAYLMSKEQVIEEIRPFYEKYGVRQLLIQGGVNPSLDLDYFTSLFTEIRKVYPKLGINGLSTSEIAFFARKAKMSIEDILDILRKSGLETIPGAGAEIFDPIVRRKIGRPLNSQLEWLNVMETAHRMGIRTSATMMYGHLENSLDRARHLLAILNLQKKYHGFLSFTPWNFEPGNTKLEKEGLVKYRVGGEEVLRNIAVSRIALGYELPLIQSSWLTGGVSLGQLAIRFGANDWGGTIYDERVIPATGKEVGNLRKEIIIQAIKQIGMVPVERDNLYNTVQVYD